MSFTSVPELKTGYLTPIHEVHQVLKTAVERNVLMFCSAPDEGNFTEFAHYPSGPWRDRFLRIGAATASGTAFDWTPEEGITYILPGVDVIMEQAAKVTHDTNPLRRIPILESKETGSGIAAALAAGLAAMVIYCVKASILATKIDNQSTGSGMGLLPDKAAGDIARPDEMKRAFGSLGKVTSNNFIPVWDELDRVSHLLEGWRASGSNPAERRKCTQAFVEFGVSLYHAAKWEH